MPFASSTSIRQAAAQLLLQPDMMKRLMAQQPMVYDRFLSGCQAPADMAQVNGALQEEMKDIHALSIKRVWTPAQQAAAAVQPSR